MVAKLKQFGVNPSDLAYPVYYDLEKWTWEGHQPPTDPNVYNNIVNNWYSARSPPDTRIWASTRTPATCKGR